MLASCAIPAVFPPVQVGQTYLIDGAVACSTPISVAVELGAKRVIVLPTGFACSLAAPPRGALAGALHAITLMVAHQLVMKLERYRGQADIVTVPPFARSRCRPTISFTRG